MRFWVKLLLFISAYTPLFLIFIIQYLNFLKYYFWIGIIILILINLIWIPIFTITENWTKNNFIIKESTNRTGDVLTYIVAYIIIFIRFQFNNWQDWATIFIIIIIIFFIFINSNLIFTNPLLNIFGYKVHDVTTIEDENLILISKKTKLKKNKEITGKYITDDIFLEVK